MSEEQNKLDSDRSKSIELANREIPMHLDRIVALLIAGKYNQAAGEFNMMKQSCDKLSKSLRSLSINSKAKA